MNYEFISQTGSQSLILFFAGWGMDANPFRNDCVPDCDMVVVWNYEILDLDIEELQRYQNIYLFAWSFGVFAATQFLHCHPTLPVVFKMAINGTQFPIDDQKGIPLNLFDATLNNLSEQSLMKFYRRICHDTIAFKKFTSRLPSRSIASLHRELTNIKDIAASMQMPVVWDKAVASKHDRIFPFENQLDGWTGWCSSLEIEEDETHMPQDFKAYISKNIVNKQLIKQRFSNSFNSSYDQNAKIQHKVAQRLYDQWKKLIGITQDASILEIGCGTGFLTRLYAPNAFPSKLILNDLCNIPTVTLNLNTTNYEFIEGDAEQLAFPYGSFDYVVSSSAIQWFENLPQFFDRLHNWLKPGGALVLSTFGPDNMKEIKEHIKISLNYKDAKWFYNEINRNFDIVLIKEETETMFFDTPLEVLRHIKSTGVNSIGSKKISSGKLKHLLESYQPKGDKFPLTYHPIYIIATNKDG